MSSLNQDCVFDLLIKNGKIYDGTGLDPYTGDIGIKGDKIAAIGDLSDRSVITIDAKERIITPGFIDVHSHYDLPFLVRNMISDPKRLTTSLKGNHAALYQGVTTVVTGNCGFGFADTDEWLDFADTTGLGTNIYTLVPHGMIRDEVSGSDQPQTMNRKQLEKMKARIDEEMQKGAVGMSTGLAYAPGLHTTTEELVELSKVVSHYQGVYTTHLRDESGAIYPNGDKGVLASIKEAIEIGKMAEISVQISHLKIVAPLNNTPAEEILELIEKARMEGMDLLADQYPYAASSTMLSMLLPDDMKTLEGIKDEFKSRKGRQKIKQAMDKAFSEILLPEKTMISSHAGKERYEGMNIKEISEFEGRTPSESYVDMVCGDIIPMAVFFEQDIDVVRKIMPRDYIITASDGLFFFEETSKPHPRAFGTFPRRIRRFEKEEKLSNLSAAIRSMTSLPAEKFNMTDRGRIEKGYAADIAVLNFDRFTDRATYTNPQQYAEGIDHLIVNGGIAISNGKVTGNNFGRALKRK